jgi:hypothetical protein
MISPYISIIYQDFLILHIFLHDSDSLIRIHDQCTEFYLIIGYLKICNFSDPRKIVLATQHLLLIFDYTFFPLSIYLKTLNKIWYLNLNKKKSSNRLRFVKLFIFKFCHFLWGELVIFLTLSMWIFRFRV